LTRRKRAKIILRLVLGLLIAALGILFVAASMMANTYDTPDRNDDALQSKRKSVYRSFVLKLA